MKKNSIIHFVGFITRVDSENFVPGWEQFVNAGGKNGGSTVLQEEAGGTGRFKFISRHEFRDPDFRFSFMKERKSEHFPDQKVKVVQAGGYAPLQTEWDKKEEKRDVKVIAFVPHEENDIEYYRHLSYRHLNIFGAYFENCAYAYVLEYFLPEKNAGSLLSELKAKSGTEAAVYKKCPVGHP